MDSTTGLLLVVSAVTLISVIYKNKTSTRHSNTPPSLPWLPIVGSLPFLSGIETFHIFLAAKSKRLGDIFSLYAGKRYIVILNGYDAIRDALVNKSSDFAGRGQIFAESLWNVHLQGIAFRQYSEEYKTIRKTSIMALRKMGFGERATMETRIQVEVSECIKYIKHKNGMAFDPQRIFQVSTLNVIFSMMFGKKFQFNDPIAEFIFKTIFLYAESLNPVFDLFPIFRYLPAFKRITEETGTHFLKLMEMIKDQIEDSLNTSGENEDFVTHFKMLTGSAFDKSELIYIGRDFITAGTETTATTLLWSLILISNHPAIQERLHKEIDSVVPGERLPSLSDKMPYLEATILEVMRIKTIAPLAVPHMTLCDTEVDGFFIPANTQVVVNLWSAHMDPKVWEKPEEFRPERFLNDAGEIINRDRMITFSLGKRSCTGELLARQEVTLFLASLIQQFNFSPPEGQTKISDHGALTVTNAPERFNIRLIARSS